MIEDYSSITEIAGDNVSKEQIARVAQRYYWAGQYCKNKDVLEVACGAGQGLGYLLSISSSIMAGDITQSLVNRASAYYGDRVRITKMTAEELPFDSKTMDVVILFEAIYYLSSVEKFISECRRVLRTKGVILLATANKDLSDFNESPFSVRYFNPPELSELFKNNNFETTFFGGSSVDINCIKGRAIRFVKRTAVKLHLIPKSMKGKKWLKRLIFGELVPMPHEFKEGELEYQAPSLIDGSNPDYVHQVIYCAAVKR